MRAKLAGAAVEEVEPGHRHVGARLLRLLHQAEHLAGGVQLDDAVAAGVGDRIAEHHGAGLLRRRGPELPAEAGAVEDVVAQHEAARLAAHERLAQPVGVGEALGPGLRGVLEREAEPRAVAQQPLERRLVVRRGDDQDLPDPGQHQHRQRVVDHRLVVDRQQLLGDRRGQRMQPRARPAGEDKAASHAASSCASSLQGSHIPDNRAALKPRDAGEAVPLWSGRPPTESRSLACPAPIRSSPSRTSPSASRPTTAMVEAVRGVSLERRRAASAWAWSARAARARARPSWR